MNKRLKREEKEENSNDPIDSRLRSSFIVLQVYRALPNNVPIEIIHLIVDFAVYTDFMDHSEYDGEWCIQSHVEAPTQMTCMRHGTGLQRWTNGDWLKGEWTHGKFMYGRGRFTENGQRREGIWDGGEFFLWFEGEWSMDWPYSKGKLYEFKTNAAAAAAGDHKGQLVYDGELQEYWYQGKGRRYYQSGNWYEGEFSDDFRHGYGVHHYLTGGVYEGQFQKDELSGKGKYVSKTGEIYEGTFKQGHCVEGRYTDKKKKVEYRGSFSHDSFSGQGTLNDGKSGLTYHGWFDFISLCFFF